MSQRNIIKVLLIALILLEVRSIDSDMVVAKTFSGDTITGLFKLGPFSTPQTLNVKYLLGTTPSISLNLLTRSQNFKKLYSLNFGESIDIPIDPIDEELLLLVYDVIPKYSIEVKLNCVTLSSVDPHAYGFHRDALIGGVGPGQGVGGVNFFFNFFIYKTVQVKNDCIIQIDPSTFSSSIVGGYFTMKSQTDYYPAYGQQPAKEIKKGKYLIKVQKNTKDFIIDTPYSFSIYSTETNTCVIEELYQCNDGIDPLIVNLQRGQQCPIQKDCKNGVLDCGEMCDNLLPGCGADCLPEKGYECSPITNVCSLKCGNHVFDQGEECDNANKEGCINCIIQPGWDCKTNRRYCVRVKANCGNGIIQVGEECDDGNNTQKNDGCTNQCTIQEGSVCKGNVGQISVCRIGLN